MQLLINKCGCSGAEEGGESSGEEEEEFSSPLISQPISLGGRRRHESYAESHGTSRTTSRASSPDRRRQYSGSLRSHQSPHVGSLSSTLTGSYIANLRNKDYASAAFRRV